MRAEVEYFNMLLENVRVVSINPVMHNCKEPALQIHNHNEGIQLRYERITGSIAMGTSILGRVERAGYSVKRAVNPPCIVLVPILSPLGLPARSLPQWQHPARSLVPALRTSYTFGVF